MSSRTFWVGLLIILLVAGGLRALALTDAFWMDEIWTWKLAGDMTSPLEVFITKHDGNHVLITLTMQLLGDLESWVPYRLPSYVAGLLSILLAGWIGCRRSRAEGLILAALFSLSYLMLVYSTEARGHALSVLFSLAAYALLEKRVDSSATPDPG